VRVATVKSKVVQTFRSAYPGKSARVVLMMVISVTPGIDFIFLYHLMKVRSA